MIKSLKILAVLLIVSLQFLNAQLERPDTATIIFSYSLDPLTNKIALSDLDTTMENIHMYNPLYLQSFSNTFLGNTGQAAITNNFAERDHYNPFIFSVPYAFYMYNPYKIQHYNTKKPFTELKYLSSGSREDSEQVLSALHTQNANKYVNVGLFYDLIASRGIYNDQNTGLNRINLFGSYNKDDYSMFTSIHYNSFKFEENGGLENLEAFRNKESDALNYNTNLNNANSRFRNLNFFYTHELKLPALISDSARKEKFKGISIQHTINFDRYSKNYTDNVNPVDTAGFYKSYFYLVNQTNDSAFYRNLSNRVDINLSFAKSQTLQAFLMHEYKRFSYVAPLAVKYELEEQAFDTVVRNSQGENFNDFSIGGLFNGSLSNWEYSASGRLSLTGYSAGDLKAEAGFTRYFKSKTYHLSLGGGISSQKPSYFLNSYGSSHFIWNNNFKNIDNTNAFAEFGKEESFRTKLTLNYFTGWVFFNTEALPEQNESEIFTVSFTLYKKFKWGPFNHSHELLVQKGAEDIIHLPALAYKNSTWYQNEVFNKVLKFKIGFDFYYFSSYYADAFMPATGMFYNQQMEKVGNYPFLDGFIDVHLKRTRFTIQYTNALSEFLVPANYFMAYRYPNFSGSFKFGLAWTFYD